MASDIAAVKLSEKGLKMMGISTDQLIDSFLKDERGSLSDETWSIFWAGLKQKKRAMDVITKLTDYFLKAIDGEFKTKLSTQSLLNTIIFLALWFKLDKSESMKRLIISWKQKLNSPEMRKINGSEKVLRLLQIRTENKEDLLEVLVSWVFKMHSKDRFQYIKTSEILTFDGEHFPDGESSSIYVFIKLMCKDKGIFTKVLNQLIVHTSVYGNKNNDFSEEEIEDSILAMLHIFRSLLSYVCIFLLILQFYII